jgi:O-antigen ligase
MAYTSDTNFQLYLARERTDVGRVFLRWSVISLMILSILAPVVRLGGEFWVKLDQLMLPAIILVFLWLMMVGLAQPIRFNGLFLVALAFTICIAMSMLYGTQVIGHPLLSRDFFELVKPLFPLLFFTLAYQADFSENSIRTAVKLLCPAVLLICLYAFGQWFNLPFTAYLQPYYSGGLHDDGGLSHYRRVYSTLSNPNFLAMLMTWVIGGFTLAILSRVGSRFWNLVVVAAALVTLTMTGSRYGIINTVLALLLIFVLPAPTESVKRSRRMFLFIGLPVMVTAILLVSMSNRATFSRFQQLGNPLQENSLRMRLDDLWKDAANQFLESPVLGHGPAKIIFSNVYTDSEYLQILKQYGVVGLIPYLGYFLVPLSLIWQGLKAISASRNPLDKEQIATYWAVGFSFILIVTSMFMNIGMGTYYNFSLAAFLWTWMGIGASSAKRIAAVTCPKANLARA